MHNLLNAFKARRPALGIWLTTPGFFHARTVALAHPAISWVCFDTEHGLVPGSGALVRVAATGLSGSSSTNWQIKHALDAGARGVVVPMVSTPQQAADVVADSKFPPLGRRGLGSAYTQMNWGMTVKEYIAKANDGVLVVVQIETREGLYNVKEIAAVDGVDALLIGPYDLSISLGFPAPSPDPVPEVEEKIQYIRTQTQSVGKKCAIYCTSGAQAARRVKEGFDMVNVISDVGALSNAISEHVSRALAGQESD
ncbi:Pyruvate/Phosphoenolpyruvate kinase-like domain-containing protein [Mycena amicta]|nr:Pyruvate/Phosphoenolpyruvate kinase-like domain-containing protein [Mycena amicta]